MGTLEVRILGSVDARVDGRPIRLGTAKQRCLLALLALDAPGAVHVERLIDLLWGSEPPPGAKASVQAYISRLRGVFAGCEGIALSTNGPSYRLDVGPDLVDVHRFRRLVAEARACDDDADAARLLGRALGLWRGGALDDVAPPHLRSTLCANLEEERLAAREEWADTELRLGNHVALLGQLRDLVERNPLRERLAAALITALYRNQQRADALAQYQRLRTRLAEELGIDPSPEIEALHQRVLRDDAGLAAAQAAGDGRSGGAAGTGSAGRPGNTRVTGGTGVAGRPGGRAVTEPPVVPAQLPADIPTFTGRTAELAWLPVPSRSSAPGTVRAIDGMAGVGKTTLAVHWAHSVRHLFPDGQIFLDLHGHSGDVAPVDPAAALDRVLRSLGMPGDRIPRECDSAAALYRSVLAGRRVLVLLDNAASESQVRPLIPGTPGCLVIVTSRRRLTGMDGVDPLSLDALPAADAFALFVRVAGPRHWEDIDTGPVREVVELCGGLPLAVRLAAARLRARPAWTPRYLAELLRDERHRLSEIDGGRSGVAAAFALSYRELAPDRRRLFRLLGLHPGTGLDAPAAAALAGVADHEARRMLEDLVDAHLLDSPTPGRYVPHDLLATYAAERAADEEPEPARQEALTRLFDHYVATASVASALLYPHDIPPGDPAAGVGDADRAADPVADRAADRAAAAAWLDAELPTLLAVAGYAADRGWTGHAARLSRALWRYLPERARYSAALALHGHAARAAERAGDLVEQARALVDLATVHGRLGGYDQALDHLHRALATFRRAADPAGEVRALGNLGVVHERVGDYEQAAIHLGQALELLERAGDRRGEGPALLNLGILHGRTGRYDLALDHLSRALTISEEAGNRGSQARALVNLGITYARMGRHDLALERHERALRLFREIGSRDQEGVPITAMGVIHRAAGRHDLAIEHHQRALALFRETGNHCGEAEALGDLGRALRAAGRPAEALSRHRGGLAIAERIGERYEQARAHDGLARAYRDLGDHDRARSHWRVAAGLFARLRVPDVDEVLAELDALERSPDRVAG